MHEKTEYIVHKRNSKQALNHGLVLKKIHRAISFNQDKWLKSYTELNTKLRRKVKNEFGKNIYKLMNNSVFSKTMKNLRKDKDLKLIKTERRGKYLVSQPNYYSTRYFSENLISIEMKKKQIIMNKPVCLGLLIIDLSKTVIYEFWCLKPKHGEKAKLCYMDTYSLKKRKLRIWSHLLKKSLMENFISCAVFIVHVKTDSFYKDIEEDVETKLDT